MIFSKQPQSRIRSTVPEYHNEIVLRGFAFISWFRLSMSKPSSNIGPMLSLFVEKYFLPASMTIFETFNMTEWSKIFR
jgi:hypothetical protein